MIKNFIEDKNNMIIPTFGIELNTVENRAVVIVKTIKIARAYISFLFISL